MNDPLLVAEVLRPHGEWNHTCTTQCPVDCPAAKSQTDRTTVLVAA